MSASQFLALWFLCNIILLGVWDVLVLFDLLPGTTVSEVIHVWVARWPLLAVAIGGLIVHLVGIGPRPKA